MNEFTRDNPTDFPGLDLSLLDVPTTEKLSELDAPEHKPRILLLYGSTRERSFSQLLTREAARLLELMGAETAIFDPFGLPLPDDAPGRWMRMITIPNQSSVPKLSLSR